VFTLLIPRWYGATATLALTPAAKPLLLDVSRQVGIWAVEAALVLVSRRSPCSRGRAWRRRSSKARTRRSAAACWRR